MEEHGLRTEHGVGKAMDTKIAAVDRLIIEECILAVKEKTWSTGKWTDLVEKVLARFTDVGPQTLRSKLAYAIAIIGTENRELFYLAFRQLSDWSPIGGPYWVIQEEMLRQHILFFIGNGLSVSIDLDNGDDTSAEDMVDLEEAKEVIYKIFSDVRTASVTNKILRERMIELRSEFLKLIGVLESVTSTKEAHDLFLRVEKKFPLTHFVNLFMDWAQTILVNTEPLQNQYVDKIVDSPVPCRPPRAIARAGVSSSSIAMVASVQQTKILPSSPLSQDLPEEDTSVEDDVIDDKATDDLRNESGVYDRGDPMDDFGEPMLDGTTTKPTTTSSPQSHRTSSHESASISAHGKRESGDTDADALSLPPAAAVTRFRGMKRSFERAELGRPPDEKQQQQQSPPTPPQSPPQPQQPKGDKQQAQDRAMMQILSEVMYQPPPASPGVAPAVLQPSFASPPAALPADASAQQQETDKDETECGSELTSSPSTKSSTSTVEVRYYVSPSDLNAGAPEEEDDRERGNGGILTPWKTICRLFTS